MRIKGRDTIDMAMSAGQNHCPAGRADGIGAEAVIKSHALIGNAVEVGGLVDSSAVAAHGMGGMVIGHNKNNIGLFGAG